MSTPARTIAIICKQSEIINKLQSEVVSNRQEIIEAEARLASNILTLNNNLSNRLNAQSEIVDRMSIKLQTNGQSIHDLGNQFAKLQQTISIQTTATSLTDSPTDGAVAMLDGSLGLASSDVLIVVDDGTALGAPSSAECVCHGTASALESPPSQDKVDSLVARCRLGTEIEYLNRKGKWIPGTV
jgi:hypothetical protein